MKKSEVEVGKTYVAKVSGALVPVKLTRVSEFGGWVGTNTTTGREVRIRSAAKLRREYGKPAPAPVNKYGEEVFLHGPVCSQCSQRVGKFTRFLTNEVNQILCWRCAGFAENEVLESASVCSQCGAEAVAPKSLCCGKVVVTPTLAEWVIGRQQHYVVTLAAGAKRYLPVTHFKRNFPTAGNNFQARLVQIKTFFADAIDWELEDELSAAPASGEVGKTYVANLTNAPHAGDRVRLKPDLVEGFPEEFGVMEGEIDNGSACVRVDKKYRTGPFDDGLREVTSDQVELSAAPASGEATASSQAR